jgi:hypothetical protein
VPLATQPHLVVVAFTAIDVVDSLAGVASVDNGNDNGCGSARVVDESCSCSALPPILHDEPLSNSVAWAIIYDDDNNDDDGNGNGNDDGGIHDNVNGNDVLLDNIDTDDDDPARPFP